MKPYFLGSIPSLSTSKPLSSKFQGTKEFFKWIEELGIIENPRKMHIYVGQKTHTRHKNVHSGIPQNSPQMEISPMFINNRLDELWYSLQEEYCIAMKMNYSQ